MNPALVDAMEEELVGGCDVVFTTAAGLCERLSRFNQNTYMIPNGADFELFSKAASPLPCPDDMKSLPHPIFGFVGMLQECIAYDYAISLARSNPVSSLVFIGRELPGVDLSELKALSNVYFLGLKPHDKLPEYIAQFDVCLNMFAAGELSKDVSPLKFYEYLATGKPIVSTPEPLQVRDFADVCHIAENADEFVKMCSRALHDDEKTSQVRMQKGRAASWDARVGTMEDILKLHKIFV